MRRGGAAVLVIGLLAASTGLAPAAPHRDTPTIEQRNGRTLQAAGYWSIVEPGPDGTRHETEGAVWLPLERAKGVRCFGFEVERTSTEAMVTAFCDPGDGRGKLKARFEVTSWVWDGQFGRVTDDCVDRHNVRRNPVFTCTVANPGTTPSP